MEHQHELLLWETFPHIYQQTVILVFALFYASLKDKYTHNTCQIYVKPHSKNTQITLESQIFDEKALR